MRRRRESILERESGEYLGRVVGQQLRQGVDPRLQHAAEPLAITAEPPRGGAWWAAGRHVRVALLVDALDGLGAHAQQDADGGGPLPTLGQDAHLASESL